MAQKVYVVDGRQFRTESDYACANRDKQIIDKLRQEVDFGSKEELEALLKELRGGKYKFMTLLGQDFRDEVEMCWKKAEPAVNSQKSGRRKGKNSAQTRAVRQKKGIPGQTSAQKAVPEKVGQGRTAAKADETARTSGAEDPELEKIVEEELRKREKRRRLTLLACSAVAVCCLGYFAMYSYYDYRTQSTYKELSNLKELPTISEIVSGAVNSNSDPLYTLDGEPEQKEVLEEYKNLLLKNQKLIGWVKIDGTNIDYPVMQTTDNEYYLTHNIEQEYDRNGTIFMDKDCDVLKPSTNFILYGHHMKSGRMFGQLDLYKDKSFYEEHPYISFDTIYEKGTYQVMYVFRSRVYKETEIVFKYYQFIDANGEPEFDSYMEEMAGQSLYETGVTAEYGDRLLTLSTCDYEETDGRFVVVAKKVENGGQ